MFASSRQELEEALDETKRAIRFARDEAILRGRVVRLLINLDNRPHTLSVEYGPDENFVLPNFLQDDAQKLSSREREEREKKEKKLNQSFSPISEYQDEASSYNENVVIAGIGTTLTESMFYEGNVSLFFYPSGEKDGAFITFTTGEEIATLSYPQFANTLDENFEVIDEEFPDDEALEQYYQNVAKEGFEAWIK